MLLWALPQARSSHRLEGSNEPPFVRQVSFFSCSLYERALSRHHTTSLQLKQSLKNLVERDCQRVCTKAVRWASPRPRLRWVYKKLRSRWNQHSSSSSIAQHAVCHSCKVLQSTMKRMKESDMDGQTKLFSFGFSRGRSGNQPEPNGLTLLLLVHLSRFESLRPRKSRQAVFKGSTYGANLQGEVRARAFQIPTSSHIWRTETELSTGASPSRSAFWTAGSDSSRQNGWTRNGLRTPHGRTEVSVYHALSFIEVVVKMLITKPMTNWKKRFNNPEGAHCQQNAQSVRDAAQLQNEDPNVASLRRSSSTKRPRYLSKQAETLLDLGLHCLLINVSSCVEGKNCMMLKRCLDMAEQTGLTWNFWPR